MFLAIAVDNLANAQELTAAEEADEKNNEPRVSGGLEIIVLFIFYSPHFPRQMCVTDPGSIVIDVRNTTDHLFVIFLFCALN